MKKVCIVGAGPAGLAGAKVLLHSKKFDVTVFEKADRIGGIWALDEDSSHGLLPPETPTNLSRFTVGFSDLDWHSVDLRSKVQNGDTTDSPKVPMFPKAWQVNRYLEAYRRKNIPDGIIKFDQQVTKTERIKQGERVVWNITTQDQRSQQKTTTEFDYLMLGSGFFSTPRPLSYSVPGLAPKPVIPTIHSSQFRRLKDLFPTPETATGKTILIIGGGNSAGEVAAAVAQQLSDGNYSPTAGQSQPFRNFKIVHVTPRPLYAIPPFSPIDEDNTAFVPLDLKLYDLSKRPAGPIQGNAGILTKAVKDMIHSGLQGTIGGDQSDLGTPALTIPEGEPRSTVYAALSESFSEFVRSGLIEAVGGRVTALEEGKAGNVTARVASPDGHSTIEDVGAVIYATGYSPAEAIDFLPEDVKRELHYDASSLRLPLILQGWQTTTASVLDLALLGFYEGPYWPMIEMQARFTAHRWLSGETSDLRSYEETQKLLDLRKSMKEKGLDVPQYWFGDYAGYLEEVAAYLKLNRNDAPFAEREGCTSPARYLSSDSDPAEAKAIVKDLHQVWHACRAQGRFTARAVFRALQGNWSIERSIDSSLSSFPSGTLRGEASFHPRAPTQDKSGLYFDLEYLYVESGTLTLSNGAAMPARRRYVYRYSEERDELSAWFVKPEQDFEVDYLFHNFQFIGPQEAKTEGACVAHADHPCVDDMYYTEYRFPLKGIALHEFQVRHAVRGPSKDYVATTVYRRPQMLSRAS